MLTYRERIYASINRNNIDAIPWQFDLTSAVCERLKAYYGTVDIFAEIGDHMIGVGYTSFPQESDEPLPPGLMRDELGAVWRHDSIDYTVGDVGGLIDNPLKEPCLAGYTFPDGSRLGRWDHLPAIRQQYPDHFLWTHAPALFESGWFLCGFQNYLGYIAGEPNFVEELNDHLTNFSCQLILQLKGLGMDGIRFGDDWGFQDHLMLRPVIWRKLYKKYYQRIYQTARDLGLIVMIHSCGNITDILPDLVEIGVQVVHPLQPEVMDIEYCKREFGKNLTFWGGLGSQSTLPLGTPEAVKAEVRHCLELFKDGGYILAPAGAAPAETPVENIAAIVEIAKAQLTSQHQSA